MFFCWLLFVRLGWANVEPCQVVLPDAIVRVQYYADTPVSQPLCVTVIDLPHTTEQILPAVVMLHGLGDEPSSWVRQGVVQLWLDAMRDGRIPPMRVVLPQGNEGYWTNQIEGEGRYRDWIVTLLDTLEADALMTKDQNILMGVSMGGYGALSIGLTHPERFTNLLALSPTDLEIATHLQPNRSVYTRLFGSPINPDHVAAIEPSKLISRGAGHGQRIAIVVGEDEPSKFKVGVERLDLILKPRPIPYAIRVVPKGCHCWSSTWNADSQQWLIDWVRESLESEHSESQ